jgi:hypothetical protein
MRSSCSKAIAVNSDQLVMYLELTYGA